MSFTCIIEEEDGFCPQCSSADTVTIRGKAKRVCLDCEFSEEFESYETFVAAWQKRSKNDIVRPAIEVLERMNSETGADLPAQHKREIEKFIEVITPEITKVTLPTRYRDDFSQFLSSNQIQLSQAPQTDVWNGIESAYTNFELRVKLSTANELIETWHINDDLIVNA